MMTDFSDPVERLRLIEQIGAQEYTRRMRAWLAFNVLDTVNGYPLRKVRSRFGVLVMVEGTDRAFRTFEEAAAHARSLPRGNYAEQVQR